MSENYLVYAACILRQPQILSAKKHIFLLSHMRANTSLIGHILGNHSKINGYYETHNGYYSEKSLLRQKLLFHSKHPTNKVTPIYFDKVLHNEHAVVREVLQHTNCSFLLSLRQAEISIKSAVAQFRKKRPGHEFCEVKAVVNYYITRLQMLEAYAEQLSNSYFYYDAELVVENSEYLLNALSKFLRLEPNLQAHFSPQALTGTGTSGDHSGKLMQGKIIKQSSNYDEIELPRSDLRNAETQYQRSKQVLIKNACATFAADL